MNSQLRINSMFTVIELGFRPTQEGVEETILATCRTMSKSTNVEFVCYEGCDMQHIFAVMDKYHGKTMEGKDAIPFLFEDGGIWRPMSDDPNKDKNWSAIQPMNFTRHW